MPPEVLAFSFGTGPAADLQSDILLNRDPPDHTRLRTLMGKAFSASLVRRLRDHIAEAVDDLLAPMLDRQRCDLVEEIAFPLPTQVICELLDISTADRLLVRGKATDLTGVDVAAADRATSWFREYMGAVLAEREADAEGDLFQRMLAAEDGDDALTHEEIVDNAILLFVAGFETTKNLIANGCVAMFRHPSELDRLWGDPGLAGSAVEEFLRFDGPVPFVQRLTTEPLEVGTHIIKPRRVVLLMLGSANHDETVFEDAEMLDIGRAPNPHVAFGGGIHHCLGAQLARVEGEVVFRRLAERTRRLEPAGGAVRAVSAFRSFLSVPVVATPA
jgi:cytochrome P450